jgi:N-acetylmuramoyl-L-alanine amidase
MKRISTLLAFVFLALIANPTLAAKPVRPPAPEPTPNSVCIDPGHGGSEIGTSNQDLLEKDVNLKVAELLRDRLLAEKYTVYMTREEDRELSNADRYNFCNSMNTAILLSIHHNGSTDPKVNYTMALYMKSSDVALAREVSKTVSSTLGLTNNGISKFASGVLLKSNMPATISEGFFLTNSKEYDLIKNQKRLEQEADALFAAIQNYFGN